MQDHAWRYLDTPLYDRFLSRRAWAKLVTIRRAGLGGLGSVRTRDAKRP